MSEPSRTGSVAMSVDELTDLLPSLVPFVGKLGITYEHMDATAARASLTWDPSLHNRAGTLHAGAVLAMAESATGAVVVGAAGQLLGRVTPVVFHEPAKGDVVATASATSDLADAVRGRGGEPVLGGQGARSDPRRPGPCAS